MSTIRESLKGLTNFPIADRTIETVALKRGLTVDDNISLNILNSQSYRLAVADIYKWLYGVANMGQGGQSYSFTAEDKSRFKSEANKIYTDCGKKAEIILSNGVKYGYKGDTL